MNKLMNLCQSKGHITIRVEFSEFIQQKRILYCFNFYKRIFEPIKCQVKINPKTNFIFYPDSYSIYYV